jgi:hypothetical protein
VIRYVLAIVLTAALLGASYAAIDQAAVKRSETQVERAIADVEAAAQSLAETEEVPPPGAEGPRRVVRVDLPAGGFTTDTVETLTFDPVPGTGSTVVTYRFDGRATRTTVVDVSIRNADSGTERVDLSGESGRLTIVLELRSRSESGPVVEATV